MKNETSKEWLIGQLPVSIRQQVTSSYLESHSNKISESEQLRKALSETIVTASVQIDTLNDLLEKRITKQQNAYIFGLMGIIVALLMIAIRFI